jgi:hypothetical protein
MKRDRARISRHAAVAALSAMTDSRPDEVRCLQCGRAAFVPPEFRGKRLKCSRCGGTGLNVTTIEPDPGNERERKLKAQKAMREQETTGEQR